MATIHQENADRIMRQMLAASPADGAAFMSLVNDMLPTWQTSSVGERGYLDDPLGETVVVIARALHDALPAPFNLFPFDWRNQHGMHVVSIYASQISKEHGVASWLQAAIDSNAAILANT